MDAPIAFLFTITTYGTWLPGDERGWVELDHGWQLPSPVRQQDSEARMSDDACVLNKLERSIVEQQISETCECRGWKLHAVNCRTNHVHAVVSAHNSKPKKMRDDLKAWCTRRLRERSNSERSDWWTERGSIRFVYNEQQLERVIAYVMDAQDRKHLDDL